MTDLALRPAVDLVAALRARRVGAPRAARPLPGARRASEPRAQRGRHARRRARARARADAADAARARGASLGPLHGLPMTVKDTLETAGLRTTAGAPELAEHVPARDATLVARLRAAGAVIFGKTNTPLFAGDAQTYNPVFGVTRNPWDLDALVRRVVGRLGGRGRRRACGGRGRQRHRRLDPQPGALLRRVRLEADARDHPRRAATSRDRRARSATSTSASWGRWRGAPPTSMLLLDVLAGPRRGGRRRLAARVAAAAPRVAPRRIASRPGSTIRTVPSTTRYGRAARRRSRRSAPPASRSTTAARPVADLGARLPLLRAAALARHVRRHGARRGRRAGARRRARRPGRRQRLRPLHARRAAPPSRLGRGRRGARSSCARSGRSSSARFDVLLCPITPTAAIPHDHAGTLLSRTIR